MKFCTVLPIRLFSLFCLLILTPLGVNAQCATADAGPDQFVCGTPGQAQLDGSIGGDYLSFAWVPTTGMSGATTLMPTVNVNTTTTYVLRVRAIDYSINAINNGDFEGGPSGFTSDYTYNPGDLWPEGVYDVLTDPNSAHANFASCGDHTSGSGQMMVVNGNGTPNQNVWCQTVDIQPNTDYAFSAWGTSVNAASPAMLQFSINGTNIGNIFSLSPSLCNWQQFTSTWNSGANTSATICVVNQNTALSGNDFALDDISFSPICVSTDTVVVHVINLTAVATPASVMLPCEGAQITLSGVGSSVGDGITYLWETTAGNIVSGENTLNPVVDAAGAYTLTVSYDYGGGECTKTATANVIQSPNALNAWITPPLPIGCGGNNVNLVGNSNQGAVTYAWSTVNGNFVSGENNKIATVNQPGDYEVIVTNTVTGCTAVAEVTVTTATAAPTAIAQSLDTLSCVLTSATLTGAGSSTGILYNYAWTPPAGGAITSGQGTLTAEGNTPGQYILAVTNQSNGCISYDTVTVLSNLAPPQTAIAPPGGLNCQIDTLTLNATLLPANATFNWTASAGGQFAGGQNSLSPQINAAGDYQIIAVNPLNGCRDTASVHVAIDTLSPLATAQPGGMLTCQQFSVTLSGTGSSTGANISYVWNGGNIVSGQGTLSPVVNAAATYTLVVTNDNNHCTATATTTVTADANAVTTVANVPGVLNCMTDSLILNTNGSSSTPGLTYQWTTTTGVIQSGFNTPNPVVSAPGTYMLTITNPANGCSATDIATVMEDLSAPPLSFLPADTLTCAAPTISLQGLVNGQTNTAGYTVIWTAGPGAQIAGDPTQLNVTAAAPGMYNLQVTNQSNGCVSMQSITVAQEAGVPIALIAAPDTLTCYAPIQILDAGASSGASNLTYQWSTLNGHFIGVQNQATAQIDQAGSYTLILENPANGCRDTANIDVQINKTAPVFSIPVPDTLTCTVLAQTLSVTPNFTHAAYQWIGVMGQNIQNPSSAMPTVTEPGDYALTVTDLDNGCTAAGIVHVIQDTLHPVAALNAPTTITCTTNQIPLSPTLAQQPGWQYAWSATSGGQIISPLNQHTVTVISEGIYALIVRNPSNGCTAQSQTAVVENTTPPTVNAGPDQILNCQTIQLTLNATVTPPNANWSWSTSGGNIAGGQNLSQPLVNAPGQYIALTTDPVNGCQSADTVLVDQNIIAPPVDAGPDTILSCAVDQILIGAGGPSVLQYAWTTWNGGSFAGATTMPQALIDAPGFYALLVTNPINHCTAQDTIMVAQDANAPVVSIAPPNTLTCITQQVDLLSSGTTGPNISYAWSIISGGNFVGAQTNPNAIVNGPGVYAIEVTNTLNGCKTSIQTTVNQDVQPPVIDAGAGASLTCNQTSLTLQGTSAGQGVSWTWSTITGHFVNGQNSASPLVDAPGIYSAVATNPVNGCSATDAVQIGIDTLHPTINIATPATLTCLLHTLNISATVQQPPTGQYTLAWNTSGGHFTGVPNSLSPQIDQPGLYSLTVENNNNGCTATAQTQVNQNITPPIALIAQPDTLTCIQNNITLDGSASGGGAITYQWSGAGGVSDPDGVTTQVSTPGTYRLIVTNSTNGCADTATVIAPVDRVLPDAIILSPPVLNCTTFVATLMTTGSSFGPRFQYVWNTTNGHFVNPPGGATEAVIDQPGLYTITITDTNNGCTQISSVHVTQSLTPPLAQAGPDGVLHCNQTTFSPVATGSGIASVSFAWGTPDGQINSGAQTQSPTVSAPGHYTVTVTDSFNGCTNTDLVLVTEIPDPQFEYETDQPDCLVPLGTVVITNPSGGVEPYVYSIDGGQTFVQNTDFQQLQPGVYHLAISDANGCTSEQNAFLQAPFYPSVDLQDLYQIELGDSVHIVPQTVPSVLDAPVWQWSPIAGLDCSDCPDVWARPLQNATYTVVVTDANGCTATDRTTIEVDRQRHIWAPNIISPNDDGDNDRFTLYGRGVVEIKSLHIYDRWGSLIWTAAHLQINHEPSGWNGDTVKGTPLNPGVFVWKAQVEFPDGAVEQFVGDVTVFR